MALKDLYSYIAIMYFKKQQGLFSHFAKKASKQTNQQTHPEMLEMSRLPNFP